MSDTIYTTDPIQPPPPAPKRRKRRWIIGGLAVLVVAGAIGAAAEDEPAADASKAPATQQADPAPAKPKAQPKVDPDQEWAAGFVADGGSGLLGEAADEMEKSGNAATDMRVDEAITHSTMAAALLSNLADMTKGDTAPLAVQSHAAFTGCETAYTNAAAGMAAMDAAAIQQATGQIVACTADLNGIVKAMD